MARRAGLVDAHGVADRPSQPVLMEDSQHRTYAVAGAEGTPSVNIFQITNGFAACAHWLRRLGFPAGSGDPAGAFGVGKRVDDVLRAQSDAEVAVGSYPSPAAEGRNWKYRDQPSDLLHARYAEQRNSQAISTDRRARRRGLAVAPGVLHSLTTG